MIGLLQNLPFLKRQQTSPTAPLSLELSDIQGLIISAYPHLRAMRYWFWQSRILSKLANGCKPY
jgi:hypothetical protein